MKHHEMHDAIEAILAPIANHSKHSNIGEAVAPLEKARDELLALWRRESRSDEIANMCSARTLAVEELAKAREVISWAQAALTTLNVGDVLSGSPLHLKLRDVLIAYREAKDRRESK